MDKLLIQKPKMCVWGKISNFLDKRKRKTQKESQQAFIKACIHGDEDTLKTLLCLEGDQYIDVHTDNEYVFRMACSKGHHKVVKRLLQLDGDRYIDVHAENEYAFRMACSEGHHKVVKRLLKLDGERRINIHADNASWFHIACKNEYTNMFIYLYNVDGERVINANEINEYALHWIIYNDDVHPERVEKCDKQIVLNILKSYIDKYPEIYNKYKKLWIKYPSKPTKHMCLIMMEPIEQNEMYVECVKNPEHVFSAHNYDKTTFTTCLVCQTNQVAYYTNSNSNE